MPYYLSALNIISKHKLIDESKYHSLEKSIKLILLVKFTLLKEYRKTNDSSLIHLSNTSLDKSFELNKNAYTKIDIFDLNDFKMKYYEARSELNALVNLLYAEISAKNPDLSQLWHNLSLQTTPVPPAEITSLINSNNWQEIVPLALYSQSDDVLYKIVELYGKTKGFEYILRIISENKYISDQTKEALLSSYLPQKLKLSSK